jgi:glycyl-tRNA synthetase
MEMEFFVPPAEAPRWYDALEGRALRLVPGARQPPRPPAPARARPRRAQPLLEPAPPTSSTCSRSAGPSSRASPTGTDFDLKAHAEHSGTTLEYFDPNAKERYVPHVIEPAAGADRATLAFLADAYDEEEVEGESRTSSSSTRAWRP